MIAWCNGIEIGYDDVGSGVPLMLVHGFPHQRTLWAPQVGGLIDRARCIVPDLRGFGQSTAEPPFSIDQYADDLAALLDHLRIDRVVLGGLSMGGYVAFAFWRRHRSRVRALVLLDTKAEADTAEGRQRRKDLIALTQERGSTGVADALITGMIGKSTREKCPEIVDTVHAMLESAPSAGIIGALRAMMDRPDSTETLRTIEVPTLVVVGEEDALTPVRDAQRMHELVPGSRLEVIPLAGHVSNLERPASVSHVLSEFLSALTLS